MLDVSLKFMCILLEQLSLYRKGDMSQNIHKRQKSGILTETKWRIVMVGVALFINFVFLRHPIRQYYRLWVSRTIVRAEWEI